VPKKTKAGGGKIKHTEVVIVIKNHDAPQQQLEDLIALGESLAPKFLAEIGAAGKQFEVTSNNKHRHK